MAKNKKQLLDDINFIEEHSEYVLHDGATWNEAQTFVAEHYDEVYEDYVTELTGICDISDCY